jgi:hypothetical protein
MADIALRLPAPGKQQNKKGKNSMSQTETRAMLRNVIFKLKETKTHTEIMGWLVAEAVTVLKDLSFSEPEIKQAQAKPATIQDTNNATGPRGETWKPPVGGFYRHDGRFVKDETWKPAEKPAVEESKPSVPDVLAQVQQGTPVKTDKRLIAVTLPNGSQKFYDDTPEFRVQREKEAKAQAGQQTIVAVPKPVDEPKRVPPAPAVLNTHTDHMTSFTQAWDGPAERND